MSLLTLIGEPGPVRDWLAANFGHTPSVCRAANRELRGGSEKEPCAVPPVPGTEHGLVGTAVGYVLAAHLRQDGVEHATAMNGARMVDLAVRSATGVASAIERQAVARVRELGPFDRALIDAEWEELLRLCMLLARFEQVFRVGMPALEYLVPPFVQHHEDLDALTRAVVTEPTLSDLDAVSRATVEDHVHLRDSKALYLGPTFAQSDALGGADADVIADGNLIELKSSGRGGVFGRTEAWQLLGYLFADTDDLYKIERCSVFALRRRRTRTWRAQRLVDALAGGPSEPVEYWRAEFAALLVPVAEARQRQLAELVRQQQSRRT